MADAMSSIIESASKPMDVSGVVTSGISGMQAGMDIAQRQQKMEQEKQSLQFQKDQHELDIYNHLHEGLHSAVIENDPTIRKAQIEDWANTYTKLRGTRPSPAILNLMQRSDTFADRVSNFLNFRKAVIDKDQSAAEQLNPQLDYAMTSSVPDLLKQLSAFENAQLLNSYRAANLGIRKDDQAKKAAEAITNDSVIKTLQTQQNTMESGLNLIKNKSTITNQEFNDFQIEFGNAIAGARNSGLGKLERTEYNTYQQRAAELKQKITGEPTDAVPQEIRDRLIGNAQEFLDKLQEHKMERAKQKKTAFPSNPNAEKQQAAAIEGMKKESDGMTPEELAKIKSDAIEALKAVRANPKAHPGFDESSIKSKYKQMTGRILVE